MSYFIVLFFLILFALSLSYLLHKSFGQIVAVTNFLYIFFLYFAGLFAKIKIGAYAFYGVIFVVLVIALISVLRKKELKAVFNIIRSPAFILYFVLGIGFGILFYWKTSRLNDEMTHWALVVKNMFAFDNFGNIGETTTMFNRYEPASGVFMYGFQIFNSEFHNGSLYGAFNLLAISMIMPVFDFLPRKNSIGTWIVGTIFILLPVMIPMIFKTNMYFNLQVDGLLAVVWSYIYLIYATNKNTTSFFKYAAIGLACFTLILIKSSGIALMVFAFVLIIIDCLTTNGKRLKEIVKNPVFWFGLLFIVLMICFAKVSWSMYCKHYQVRAGWNSDEMTLSNIISWLRTPTEWQTKITTLFFETFFVGKAFYYGNFALQLPAAYVLIAIGLAFVVLGVLKKNYKFAIAEGVISIALMIGYGIFLLLLYLFSFSYAESERLASYPRYMLTFTAGIIMVISYMYMENIGGRLNNVNSKKVFFTAKTVNWATMAYVLLLSVGIIVGSVVLYPKYKNETYIVGERNYKVWAETVKALNPEEDSVYYAMMNFNAVEYKRVRFIATPMQCSGYTEGGSYAEGRNATEPYTGNPFILGKTTREEFIEQTAKYNYLFLDSRNNEFVKQFGDLFDCGIEGDTLYTVKVSGDVVRFEKAEIK